MNRFRNPALTMAVLAVLFAAPVFAEENKPEVKKTPVQNVGGLLFDVDEGVAVEKGGGGSVYVKSNREYMQQKLNEIDEHFAQIEARLLKIETAVGLNPSDPIPAPDSEETLSKTKKGTRVLAS